MPAVSRAAEINLKCCVRSKTSRNQILISTIFYQHDNYYEGGGKHGDARQEGLAGVEIRFISSWYFLIAQGKSRDQWRRSYINFLCCSWPIRAFDKVRVSLLHKKTQSCRQWEWKVGLPASGTLYGTARRRRFSAGVARVGVSYANNSYVDFCLAMFVPKHENAVCTFWPT